MKQQCEECAVADCVVSCWCVTLQSTVENFTVVALTSGFPLYRIAALGLDVLKLVKT